MFNRKPRRAHILGIIPLSIALYLTFLMTYAAVSDFIGYYQLQSRGKAAQAIVINMRENEVHYMFTATNENENPQVVTKREKLSVLKTSRPKSGDSVLVRYLPEPPFASRIDANYLYPITGVVAGVMIGLMIRGILGYINDLIQQHREKREASKA